MDRRASFCLLIKTRLHERKRNKHTFQVRRRNELGKQLLNDRLPKEKKTISPNFDFFYPVMKNLQIPIIRAVD